MIKILLFLAISVFEAAGAVTTGEIQGKVFDPQGCALEGASVTLFSSDGAAKWKTSATSFGEYSFSDLKSGDYLLEANASGFSSYKVEHIHIEQDQQLHLDLKLTLATVREEVSVTAASTPQAVDQVSKSLTVIDNSAIQERQDYSLLDAARLAPGVHVEQFGGPGSFSEIQIRGLRPEDTALLIDGLRLRDPSATQADASSLLESLLVTDDSRIEILRGSGSSLYGTNAIGGVLNVITDQGGGPTHGSVQMEGGSLGLLRGSALIAGGSKNDRVEYSAGIMQLNVLDGLDGSNPARTSSVQGRVSVRLTPGLQLVARLLGANSFSQINTDPQAIADYPAGIVPALPLLGTSPNATYIPSLDDPDSTLAERFATGALMLLGQPTSRLGYTVSYQVVDSARSYGNGPAGPGYQPGGNTRTDYNGVIQTANAQASFQAGKYSLLTGGYEFENESFNGFSTAALAPDSNSSTSVTQRSNSAFIQDQARFFDDRLYVSAAFRTQVFSLLQPQFTPLANAPYAGVTFAAPPSAYTGDGSAAYLLRGTQTKIRAHVGRGYRAPSLYERFGAGYDSFFGYTAYGDPLLKPEQSIALDAGIDQSFLRNKLRVSATYFYTHLQRVISFDFSGLINPATDPYGRFEGYLNTSGGFARGVEFNADWAVNNRLTLSGAYTYTDARERIPIVPDVYRSFNTPVNQFTFFAVQRIGRRVFVEASLNATSNYLGELYSNFASGAFSFPGIHRADLGASYRLPLTESKALRFFGKAENVLGQTYYEGGFLAATGTTGRGGLQFEF
jgi:iron complex outermembrane receptor protein